MAWPSERSRDGGVDEIPVVGMGDGRLYLCGKHAVGPDPEGLLQRVGADVIVCLNELSELRDRYPEYVEWLRANAPVRALHHPIGDFHAPPLDEFVLLVDSLLARLESGESLVVHCGGGIGRAGTVAVGLLVRNGADLDDALATVRAHRPMAGPEAGVQREVLDELVERSATGG